MKKRQVKNDNVYYYTWTIAISSFKWFIHLWGTSLSHQSFKIW